MIIEKLTKVRSSESEADLGTLSIVYMFEAHSPNLNWTSFF